jgi:RNA polymerase sigma-70 factor (ECF subfamily)
MIGGRNREVHVSASVSSLLDTQCTPASGAEPAFELARSAGVASNMTDKPSQKTDAPRPDRPQEARADAGAGDADWGLMDRYRAGDAPAFELLYGRHRASLRRFVARLCHESIEVEEIVQDVWMAVIRARRSSPHTAKFTTWLFSIAHRRLADYWRRRQRQLHLSNDELDSPTAEQLADRTVASADDWMQRLQDHAALMAAVDQLPPLQRAVFLMRAEGDLTLEEIAAAMGAGLEATRSRMRYALARLRAALEDRT